MVRIVVLLLSLCVVSRDALAQDQALDPLLFAPVPSAADEVTDIEGRTMQLYRLPLGLPIRAMKNDQVGVRITFPVSLTSLRITRASDLGPFARRLAIASIVPGIELEIPVDASKRLRPFAEIGFGRGTDERRHEVLFGTGVSIRLSNVVRPVMFTWGGQAMYRKSNTSADSYGGHGTFEGGVDTEVPLGFSIGPRRANAGGYVIVRKFAGLSLEPEGQEPVTLDHQFEVGASFSTTPELQVWKIKLPWLAVGYQFGRTVSGVRVYMKFPF